MRKRLRIIAAIAAPALVTALLAACTGISSGGPSQGGAQTKKVATTGQPDYFGCNSNDAYLCASGPGQTNAAGLCGPGDNGYSWCQSSAAAVNPNPRIDAQPPGGGVPVDPPYEDGYTDPGKDCVVNLSPAGSGISFKDYNHLHVQTKVSLLCAVPPHILTMTVRLEFKNAAGNWIDEGPISVLNHPAPNLIAPMVPKHFHIEAACYSGEWRTEIYWQGLKRDGQPFPDPGEPADLSSAPVEVSC